MYKDMHIDSSMSSIIVPNNWGEDRVVWDEFPVLFVKSLSVRGTVLTSDLHLNSNASLSQSQGRTQLRQPIRGQDSLICS